MRNEHSVETERTPQPVAYSAPEMHVSGSVVELTKGSDYDEDEEDFTKCIDGGLLIEPR